MPMKRAFLSVLALAVSIGSGFAQDRWPSQPIRIVNAFAAGGATDITLRTLADELRTVLGVSVVVENKPGANGIIGIEDVLQKPADGYTLLGGPSSMTSGLLTMPQKPSVDFNKAFTIISPAGEGPPSMILVRKELNIKDWQQMVDFSRKNPMKIRYASPGALTGPHIDMMLIANRLGVQWLHLPVKGGGGIMAALQNSDANTGLLNIAVAKPLLDNFDVYPVVTTAKKRIKAYPNVPTLEEVGLKGIGNTLWHAVWVRSDTPEEIKVALFNAVQKAMKRPRMEDLYRRAEMWGPELPSYQASQQWYDEAMKGFIAAAKEAAPLIAKEK
jgi:tripartite-type tricarboxylate transporter receptor subunit TctC